MPRKTVPNYSHHKATGQARVRLDGKDHYLGLYGTPESRNRYSALIADWLSRQDKAPQAVDVGRVAVLYTQHAKNRYRKNGEPTSEIHGVRAALRFLVKDYRQLPLSEVSEGSQSRSLEDDRKRSGSLHCQFAGKQVATNDQVGSR